jgi:signal transduction histidine kinase
MNEPVNEPPNLTSNLEYKKKRYQVRLLTVISFLFIPISTIHVLYTWMIFRDVFTVVIGAVIVTTLLLSYWIARTQYWEFGGALVVGSITIGVITSIILDAPSQVPLTYLCFSSLIAVMILSSNLAILCSVTNLVTAILIYSINNTNREIVVFDDLIFLIIFTIAIWIIAVVRKFDVNEINRQYQKIISIHDERSKMHLEQQKSDFIRNTIQDISHDIRTPLTTIKTSLYLLKKYTSEQEIIDKLNKVERQVNFLSALVDHLNQMAHLDILQDVKKTAIQVSRILDDIYYSLTLEAEKESKQLDLIIHDKDVYILGDAILINRCITNVISNAIKYTKPGDKIAVILEEAENCIVITIEDNGIGIAQGELSKIFERFYRVDKARTLSITDSNGYGLGLAITKRIIELHNGSIQVESELDQGTKFIITFPATSPQAPLIYDYVN